METNVKDWTRDHFISNESTCTRMIQNPDELQKIPCLNSLPLDCFKHGQLVRFRGMIQDMFNPEYFFEKYAVKDTKSGEISFRNGKYMDSARCSSNEEILMDSEKNVSSDRQTLFVISIPGLNDWAKEKAPTSHFDNTVKKEVKRALETGDDEEMDCSEPFVKKEKTEGSCQSTSKQDETKSRIVSKEHILNFPVPNDDGKACIVKVYQKEDTHKLNEVVDIVGFLSLDPLLSSIYDSEECTDDVEAQTQNPPASIVPRLHAIQIVSLAKNQINNDPQIISKVELIRSDLRLVLSQLLFGDLLAADYLICHLISSVYIRRDVLCLGTFPLNITNFPLAKYKNFPKEFYSFLTQLLPKSHYVELTLECLNDLNFIPKKDYQCNRLTSGVLQLSDNTHLVIDETALGPGKVTPCGRKNYDAISQLIKFQNIAYDFKFYPVKYDTDIPVLILSEVKSFISCVTQIPLAVDPGTEKLYPQVTKAAEQFLKQENRLNDTRQYLNMMRHAKFELNDEITEVIQEDFVKMREKNKSFTGDNLHTLMVFARLMALSHGKDTLTLEIWKKTFDLEVERFGRLPKSNNQSEF